MTGSLNSIKKFPLVWLWMIFVFLASGLVINVIQVLLLPLWIVKRDLYRWLNMSVVYLHWCRKLTHFVSEIYSLIFCD